MKFKLFNPILASITVALPLFSIVGCAQNNEVDTLYQKLLNLEKVSKVEIIKDAPNLKGKFVVHFHQLLDPATPDAGSFEQRLEIGFKSLQAVNVFVVNGYTLENSGINRPRISQIIDHYNANYFSVEYRYFNSSAPKAGSIAKEWDPDYWKYLNSKLASQDFHIILEQLKTIFKGKWIMEGGSKGGQATNVMAHYYPTDMNAYVAFVPPLAFKNVSDVASKGTDLDSNDLNRWAYGDIGADFLSTEELASRKKAIAIIDYYVLKHKNLMLEKLKEERKKVKSFITELASIKPMYSIYLSVFITAHSFWQENDWDNTKQLCQEIIDNPKTQTTLDDVYNSVIAGTNAEDPLYAYEIQAWKEMGKCNYGDIDLIANYIADNIGEPKITKETILGYIDIDEEDRAAFSSRMDFTDPIREQITFDANLYTTLNNFFTTKSDANVIEIHGGLDPWRAYYKQVEDWKESGQLANNIHVFVCPDQSHSGAVINALPENKKQEVWSLLDSWVA